METWTEAEVQNDITGEMEILECYDGEKVMDKKSEVFWRFDINRWTEYKKYQSKNSQRKKNCQQNIDSARWYSFW